MKENYALILAGRATEVIGRVYNREADYFQAYVAVASASGNGRDALDMSKMSVAIEFEGCHASGESSPGLLSCGLADEKLLFTLARFFGICEEAALRGAADLLAEFLNIVIGLASADWLEKGFDITFSPPVKTGFASKIQNDGKFYRIVLADEQNDILTMALYIKKYGETLLNR